METNKHTLTEDACAVIKEHQNHHWRMEWKNKHITNKLKTIKDSQEERRHQVIFTQLRIDTSLTHKPVGEMESSDA